MLRYEEAHLRTLGMFNRNILNLGEHEAKKQIKKAYYKLSKKFHPDIWTEELGISREEGIEKFKKIHHAYKMLTDPSYRNTESQRKSNINLDAMFQIHIPMEQALFGKKVTMTVNPTHLDAKGEVKDLEEGEMQLEAFVFEVEAPPNTAHGDRQVVDGKGMKLVDEEGNERSGDAIFVFLVKPHPKYRYAPADRYIEMDLDVTLEDMLKGNEVEVETPWGLETFQLDPGTHPDQKYEVNKLGDKKEYTLGIVIKPIYPKKEELKKENSIWSKMGIKFKEEEEENNKIFVEVPNYAYWGGSHFNGPT